jgi:predicted metal-dependent phosphotriesterase family hydrolase
MHRHVIPELHALGATERDIEMLFIDNPRRLFEA